jgi:hypothetical protein
VAAKVAGRHASALSKLRWRAVATWMVLALWFCALCQPCAAYSVLTHEEIIDLLWADQITPLLLQKYPGTTPEELRAAHAYAYGGCLIQDMGYYPFGNRFFSDLTHYVRSGDFVAALLAEAGDVNEYAFALGALAHYAADISGHPTVNAAVAQEFPKLRAKYGHAVTFDQDPRAHIRTEFGFDVVQVAKQRYTSDSYHDFIGFQVSKPVLERAFLKTYGIALKDVFGSLDLSIGTFRHAISSVIPEMTRVALLLKRDELVKENPSFAKKKFLYNLKRADFEREWGTSYQKPGFGAKFLAVLFRLMPKVGTFKALKFQMPSPETETLYLQSVNATVDQYRSYLKELGAGTLALANTDFDTAKPTGAGEYRLTDEAYARLLGKLADTQFADVPPALRQNLLDFYQNPDAVIATRRKIEEWNKTLKNIQQLKSTPAETPAGHQ